MTYKILKPLSLKPEKLIETPEKGRRLKPKAIKFRPDPQVKA
jgi:hypothetical protein